MQNKVIKISQSKTSGKYTFIRLPDPERHADLSDDFTSSDREMFTQAKSAIQTHGATWDSANRRWYILNNRDHSALIEKLLNIAAYALWIVDQAAFAAPVQPEEVKSNITDEQRQKIVTAAKDMHANHKLMKLLGHAKGAFAKEVVKAMGNPGAYVAALR